VRRPFLPHPLPLPFLLLRLLAALLCVGTVVPAGAAKADAARTVRLTASFSPERLGAATAVHLGFQIDAPRGQMPVPLSEVEVGYPAELGIGNSSLGLKNCSIERLQAFGLAGCPVNSLMGYGSALVEVPFQSGPVLEHARLTLFSGPVQDGRLGLIFLAAGESPVLAEFIFPGFVLPAGPPFGGILATSLPPIPSVPGGPDAAVVRMQTTIGSRSIVYTERVHGKTVRFRPEGVLLPNVCPRGGFLFNVRLTFQDGSSSGADATVPCPRSRRARTGAAARPRRGPRRPLPGSSGPPA
jgi:hypothetical protein